MTKFALLMLTFCLAANADTVYPYSFTVPELTLTELVPGSASASLVDLIYVSGPTSIGILPYSSSPSDAFEINAPGCFLGFNCSEGIYAELPVGIDTNPDSEVYLFDTKISTDGIHAFDQFGGNPVPLGGAYLDTRVYGLTFGLSSYLDKYGLPISATVGAKIVVASGFASPVPEVSTWWMSLAGFLLVSFVLAVRRRRTRAS